MLQEPYPIKGMVPYLGMMRGNMKDIAWIKDFTFYIIHDPNHLFRIYSQPEYATLVGTFVLQLWVLGLSPNRDTICMEFTDSAPGAFDWISSHNLGW